MVNTEADYRDSSHITIDNPVNQDHVSAANQLLAKWLREKMYGVDVREAIARAVEQMSSDVYDDQQVATDLETLIDRLTAEWSNTISGITQDAELKNARIDVHGLVYETLKKRLDTEQLNNVTHLMSFTVNDLRTLRLNGFTKASQPLKYLNQTQVNDAFNPHSQGLMIQSISQIKIKKVSDVAWQKFQN